MTTPHAQREPARVDAIARAVLYEGYSLYPYRESSLKNRRRVLFGTLLPRAWVEAHDDTGDAWEASTECLLQTRVDESASVRVSVSVRFLRLDTAKNTADEVVFAIDDQTLADLETHGRERAIDAQRSEAAAASATTKINAPSEDATSIGATGQLVVSATTLAPGVVRVRVVVKNLTSIDDTVTTRDDAERLGLGAAHVVLRVTSAMSRSARWISMVDPPEEIAAIAHEQCTQKGLWPVLAGDDAVLASPIILYDNPAIAPESAAGDLFDATEIEEILALRVQTLTAAEKAELRHDDVTRALLERVEALGPAELGRLHGALRKSEEHAGRAKTRTTIAVGEHVVLRPTARADALDVILRGMAATVVSIEETLEGEQLICVTIDCDPGRDLGVRGFPGHRFFFRPDELEVVRNA